MQLKFSGLTGGTALKNTSEVNRVYMRVIQRASMKNLACNLLQTEIWNIWDKEDYSYSSMLLAYTFQNPTTR